MNELQQDKITINGKEMEDINEFTYLGAKICRESGGMKDLRNRISKARSSNTRLKRIWNSKRSQEEQRQNYKQESSKMNKEDDRMLDVFQQKCLWRILKISWVNYVNNEEVQKRAAIEILRREVKAMENDWPRTETE